MTCREVRHLHCMSMQACSRFTHPADSIEVLCSSSSIITSTICRNAGGDTIRKGWGDYGKSSSTRLTDISNAAIREKESLDMNALDAGRALPYRLAVRRVYSAPPAMRRRYCCGWRSCNRSFCWMLLIDSGPFPCRSGCGTISCGIESCWDLWSGRCMPRSASRWATVFFKKAFVPA